MISFRIKSEFTQAQYILIGRKKRFFEKKRTKKLLLVETVAPKHPEAQTTKNFLVTFFQKSNGFLPSFIPAPEFSPGHKTETG
jgi:hypothetical protein